MNHSSSVERSPNTSHHLLTLLRPGHVSWQNHCLDRNNDPAPSTLVDLKGNKNRA